MLRRQHLTLTQGIILGSALLAAHTVLAAGSELDDDPRVFPYNGVLELNGVAYNGEVDFQFTVTAEGATDADGGACIFTEEHTGVDVYSGRFSVNIGSVTGNVPSCVFNATRVSISMAVRAAGAGGGYATLSGSQRIRPVPFALWSAEGSDFTVDGPLTTTGKIKSGGWLEVAGSDLQLGTNDGRTTGTNTQQRALVHHNSDGLYINYAGDFEGGTFVQSALSVSGATTLNNTLSVPSGQASFLRVVTNNNSVAPSYNASGWLTSDDYLRLRLWTSTSDPSQSYGLGIQSSTLFYNSGGKHVFYRQGEPRLTIDDTTTTVANNLTVSGTVKGTLSITTRSASLASNTTTNVSCTSGTMPISCGTSKNPADDEDSIGCYLDITNNRCVGWDDESGGGDGSRTVYCYCLATQ